jgi:hypothetical protein
MTGDQLTLPIFDPAPTPRQYRWYDWHTALRDLGSRARLATPAMTTAIKALVDDCKPGYRLATGHDPKYLIMQTPTRVLGTERYPRPHGTCGKLAGLTLLMDTRLPFGTFGIAHEITPTEPVPTPHHRWLSDN